MANNKATISFYGGTGTVTGANFLLAIAGQKILIDCGFIQGTDEAEKSNWDKFPYDPATIDYLFITHAHLDHVGRIGKLVKDGFRGTIYSTPPTKDMAALVMADAIGVMEKEHRGEAGFSPLYTSADITTALSKWQTLGYHESKQFDKLTVTLLNAGHILGSAMVNFSLSGRNIVFTGDLGNSPAPLLPDTEAVTNADYLVMESVYGDRNHEPHQERRARLEDIIEETMRQGGTLMIPAFSIERSQEILFEIENLMEHSRIPLVPVFIDSPLAIKITRVYSQYKDYFNKSVITIDAAGDGIFKFPQLHQAETTEESKAIFKINPRKIVIAGSGMSTGGRILHHEKAYLPDPKSTLLLVGYQSPGSLGRVIQDGARTVRIMGEEIPVRARVESITGYSAHKDSDHLIDFVQQDADRLTKVFVVMGEPKASLFLVQRLRDYLGVDAVAPTYGETVELNL